MANDNNLVTLTGLRWLGLLEKEFDTSFVDLDTFLGQLDEDHSDIIYEGRNRLTALSSVFAQLVHKSVIIFENNTKYERELNELRKDLLDSQANEKLLVTQLESSLSQLNQIAQTYNSAQIKERSHNPLSPVYMTKSQKDNVYKESRCKNEILQLRKENKSLRHYILNLQSELFGARLASKYLDKELAGRIQQIQLMGKSDLKPEDHDRLWNQLESEIHLHRHKTVVRACRGRGSMSGQKLDFPEGHNCLTLKKRQGVGIVRQIELDKKDDEGLGISVTGGKEHGVPIIISEVHPDTPASRCGQIYVGDAIVRVNGIDLRTAKHAEAAQILINQKGIITLDVMFVTPDEEEDVDDDNNVTNSCTENKQDNRIEHKSDDLNCCPSKYTFFDSDVVDLYEIKNHYNEYNDSNVNQASSGTNSVDENADTFSSITDTLPSNKFYPGVARLWTNPNANTSYGNGTSYSNAQLHQKSRETAID